MKVIEVSRDEFPQAWTDDHISVLTHGHERGVLAKAASSKVGDQVLAFASRYGVGVTVFGGLTFVDVSPSGTHGPVRFEVAGPDPSEVRDLSLECQLPDGDRLVKRHGESGRRIVHPVDDGPKGVARLLALYASNTIADYPATDFTGATFRAVTFEGDVPETIGSIVGTLTIHPGESN